MDPKLAAALALVQYHASQLDASNSRISIRVGSADETQTVLAFYSLKGAEGMPGAALTVHQSEDGALVCGVEVERMGAQSSKHTTIMLFGGMMVTMANLMKQLKEL